MQYQRSTDNYNSLLFDAQRAEVLISQAMQLHDRMNDLRLDLPGASPAKPLLWEALKKSDELLDLLDEIKGAL